MGSIKDIIMKQNKDAVIQKNKPKFEVQMIHYSKLHPSNDNFYSTDEIEALANMLALSGEIKQNLLVKKVDFGEYEVIAGHKRRLAAIFNVERGLSNFEFLPCKEEDTEDILNEYNLITTNSTQRERSHYERMQEVQRLKRIIPKLLGDVNIKGRALRKILEDETNLASGTIASYEKINKNLIPDGMQKFRSGEIGLTTADKLSGLEPLEQESILRENPKPTTNDINTFVNKKKGKEYVSESDTYKLIDSNMNTHNESIGNKSINKEDDLQEISSISDNLPKANSENNEQVEVEEITLYKIPIKECVSESDTEYTQEEVLDHLTKLQMKYKELIHEQESITNLKSVKMEMDAFELLHQNMN